MLFGWDCGTFGCIYPAWTSHIITTTHYLLLYAMERCCSCLWHIFRHFWTDMKKEIEIKWWWHKVHQLLGGPKCWWHKVHQLLGGPNLCFKNGTDHLRLTWSTGCLSYWYRVGSGFGFHLGTQPQFSMRSSLSFFICWALWRASKVY